MSPACFRSTKVGYEPLCFKIFKIYTSSSVSTMRASEALLSGINHDTEIISKSSQLRLFRRAQAAWLYLAFLG